MTDIPTPSQAQEREAADSRAREELDTLLRTRSRKASAAFIWEATDAILAAGYRRVGTAPGAEGLADIMADAYGEAWIDYKAGKIKAGDFSPWRLAAEAALAALATVPPEPPACFECGGELVTVCGPCNGISPPEPRAPSTSAVDEGAVREALELCELLARARRPHGYVLASIADTDRLVDSLLGSLPAILARLGQHQQGRGGEDEPRLSVWGGRTYAELARDDLAACVAAIPEDFGNPFDWPITLPAGHWRALARPTAPAAAQGDAPAESGLREGGGLKPMHLVIYFPRDMTVSPDRAKWYIEGALKGWWQSFATENDAIRGMARCCPVILKQPLSAAPAPQAETPSAGEVGS